MEMINSREANGNPPTTIRKLTNKDRYYYLFLFLKYLGWTFFSTGVLGIISRPFWSELSLANSLKGDFYLGKFSLFLFAGFFLTAIGRIQVNNFSHLFIGSITGFAYFVLLNWIATAGIMFIANIFEILYWLFYLHAGIIAGILVPEIWSSLSYWIIWFYTSLVSSIPFIIVGALYGKSQESKETTGLAWLARLLIIFYIYFEINILLMAFAFSFTYTD